MDRRVYPDEKALLSVETGRRTDISKGGAAYVPAGGHSVAVLEFAE